jgi:hypothetical protein
VSVLHLRRAYFRYKHKDKLGTLEEYLFCGEFGTFPGCRVDKNNHHTMDDNERWPNWIEGLGYEFDG